MESQRDRQNPQDAAPTPAEALPDGEIARLRAALDEADRRIQEAEQRGEEECRRAEGYLALLKRERADFMNYRRRMEQERAELRQEAIAGLILALLPTLDGLERALADVPTDLGGNVWVEGIRLIERSLRSALARAGLERIAAQGQRFNPRMHEALLQEEAPGHADGDVVRELRAGYRLGERVLRPAQVSVARGAAPTGRRRGGCPRKRAAPDTPS